MINTLRVCCGRTTGIASGDRLCGQASEGETMHHVYRPKGVCSNKIEFDLNEKNEVSNVRFTSGCDGNLKAVSILVEGMPANMIYQKLKGNRCGMRCTSCADQLARAVRKAYNESH